MFGATVISFLIATVNIAAQIATCAILIRAALVENIDLPMGVKRTLANMKLFKPNIIIQWTATMPVGWISPNIVYILSSFPLSQSSLTLLSSGELGSFFRSDDGWWSRPSLWYLHLLVSFTKHKKSFDIWSMTNFHLVMTFTFLGFISSPSGVISAKAGGTINNLYISSLALSLVTNAVTTLLIAYKLWYDMHLFTKSSKTQQTLFWL